jgi:hypothetical protein
VIASAASTPAPEPVATNRSAPPPPAAAEEKDSRPGAVGGDGCDAGLIRKTPWLLSPEACARAFEADPNNAVLALAIAHAEHVRGHVAETAQWAGRAIALDANLAEAYVLIARAHTDSGRSDEARAAYQRYLALAPRGWHQAEARAGGRRLRAPAAPDSPRGR